MSESQTSRSLLRRTRKQSKATIDTIPVMKMMAIMEVLECIEIRGGDLGPLYCSYTQEPRKNSIGNYD